MRSSCAIKSPWWCMEMKKAHRLIGELRLSDDVKITEKTRCVLRLYIVPIRE